MSIKEFIKEKVLERVRAVKVLSEQFDINGIRIDDIEPTLTVYKGIEQLAELFGQTVKTDTDIDSSDTYTVKIKSFVLYGIKVETRDYIKKGGA